MTTRLRSEDGRWLRPRIGFLGAGWISCLRLKSLIDSDLADVVVIADPASDARRRAHQIAPAAALVRGIDELLEADLEGVVIATPNSLHCHQAISTLSRHIAVFCEKPLGLSAKEALEVVETARSINRLLAIDFSYRFTTGLNTVQQVIRSGALGDVFSIDTTFHNAYGPDKAWFYDKRLSGGGCIIDLGIHLIDAGLWLLDFPQVVGVRSELFAKGHRLFQTDAGAGLLEDYATATIELSGSTILRVACSWRMPIGQDALIRIVAHGTAGSIEFSNVAGSFYDFRVDFHDRAESRNLCSPPDDWGGRALADWVSRLGRGIGFDPAVREGLKVAQVIDSIYGRGREESKNGLALGA